LQREKREKWREIKESVVESALLKIRESLMDCIDDAQARSFASGYDW
jgi:hypothetical protein